MQLPAHKTKIVCTISPASRSGAVLERLMLQGMNAARLNFAHGTLQEHREGVDAFGVSFVETADDILKAKDFARKRGRSAYVVAKIERAVAIDNFDAILVSRPATCRKSF